MNYPNANSGFSNFKRQPGRPFNLSYTPVAVIYTASETRDVKYSRADVVGTVARICHDRGWAMPIAATKYGTDPRIIFTTVQLNDEVQRLLG